MRIHLKTLGCRLNEAELESWSQGFLSQGHHLTRDPEQADLVIVNTCAVTGEAVRKSRKLIRRAQQANPKAKLVVSGCHASLNPAEMVGVDLVVNNRDKDHLVEIASRQLDLHAMPELATEPGENPLLARGRQRAFVKVQDGCRYRCTFCIVTLARGEERSRPLSEIVEEVKRLHQEGIQEAVLTGVHLGGYGNDIGSSLYQLIQSLLEQTALPRVRLGSLEPWDLPGHFWSLFANPRLMPHLHLPLQSGADTVLRRMARRCTTQTFRSLVEGARREVPDINITTDIITGFPAETEEEWQQTLSFVEEIGFGHLHIFGYSPRPGTKAAELPGRLSREVVKQRSQALHSLGQRLKQTTLEGYLGREVPVLLEGEGDTCAEGVKQWRGYTPNFLRVAIEAPSDLNLQNSIRMVRLDAIADSGDFIEATYL